MNTQRLLQLAQTLSALIILLLFSYFDLKSQTACELIYDTPGAHSWTVPEGVNSVEILAIGADGGNRTTGPGVKGGSGAQMTASFTVSEGDVLDIYIGEYGTTNIGFGESGGTNSGGGGGGSAVILNQSEVLIAAGGGGGGALSQGGGGKANIDSAPVAGTSAGNTAGGGGGFNADAPGDLGGKQGTLTDFGTRVQGAGLGWGSGGGRQRGTSVAGGGGGYKGGNASSGSSRATGGDSFVNTAVNSGTVISNIAGEIGGSTRKDGMVVLTLIDDEIPVASCKNMTVNFNGELVQTLPESDLWDPLTSSDNCGDVFFVSQSLSEVDCSQVGNEIPVKVVIEDNSGNTGECNSTIVVNGLPCGYSAPANGINCPNGNQASYNSDNQSFTISSEGCYDPNYYTANDSHGYIGTSLCGDGEIIAQVTQVGGNGWAGVSMREGTSSSDKMLQLLVDGVYLTRRELRQSSGGIAFAHQFSSQGKIWLRLTRSGNTFGAYHSADGINWQAVLITNIPMANCIEVGMVTRNSSPSGTFTATFENFEVKSPSALQAPNVQGVDIAYTPQATLEVYPNPAKGQAWIQFDQFDRPTGPEMTIEVYNNIGQLVYELPNEVLGQQRIHLDVANWLTGMYLVQMKADGKPVISKKLIVSD